MSAQDLLRTHFSYMSFHVAGVEYGDFASRKHEISTDAEYLLVAEPANPADPHAIMVMERTSKRKVGYVPRSSLGAPQAVLNLFLSNGYVLFVVLKKVDSNNWFAHVLFPKGPNAT